jgi:DNA-binding response OmpR family regulator
MASMECAKECAKKRILIVDDESEVVEFIRDTLEPKYDVLAVLNGKEALSVVERERVDLILLDIAMPDMEGNEVLRRIRGNPDRVAIPICMVTALAGRNQRIESYRAGADEYLVKPFRTEALLETVARLLGESVGG